MEGKWACRGVREDSWRLKECGQFQIWHEQRASVLGIVTSMGNSPGEKKWKKWSLRPGLRGRKVVQSEWVGDVGAVRNLPRGCRKLPQREAPLAADRPGATAAPTTPSVATRCSYSAALRDVYAERPWISNIRLLLLVQGFCLYVIQGNTADRTKEKRGVLHGWPCLVWNHEFNQFRGKTAFSAVMGAEHWTQGFKLKSWLFDSWPRLAFKWWSQCVG